MSASAAAPEHDAAWHEREYNPRVDLPDAAAIYGRWAERGAAFRERHPPTEIRYGEHPREVLDLFRPAGTPRGSVLFIHGGYWRAFSKSESSWIASAFLEQGLTVAIPSYPLCPDVRLGRIREAIRAAFVHLHREVFTVAERDRLVATGHSAGGYLTALLLATDWTAHGLPADPLAGAMPISGVFDVAPLIPTSMNDALRLDMAEALTLDLLRAPIRSRARLAIAVGGAESAEFHRQSEALAESWAELAPDLIDVPARNHFDVIDDLAVSGGSLNAAVLRLAGLS